MKNKGVTIAALIIAIIGLSIGFAAFSNTLTIRSSASVNPDSSAMNVVWSSSSSSAETDAIVPTLQPNNVASFTSANATITGTDYRTLDNVTASFTEPGQTVTYNLFVYNAGQYPAYLTDLTFGSKSCSAITENVELANQATQSLVTQACEGISISVTIGTKTLSSSGFLDNQALAPNTSVQARVVITYAAGSAYVDGPMSVTFGDITFTASTVQAPVVTPSNPWITRGLTSSSVAYGETYTRQEDGWLPSFEIYNTGGAYLGQNLDTETIDGMIGTAFVGFGSNYFIMTDGVYYQALVFDGEGTATWYGAPTSVGADLNAIMSYVNALDETNGYLVHYSIN